MTQARQPIRKTALAIAAALALGAAPSQQVLAASCTWNPATGNWSVAANWSCGIVPTGGPDDAIIGAAKVVTINTAQSVRSLTNSGGVNIDAFLLTLSSAGSTVNTGTINIGAGAIPNNAALQVSGGHNINNTGGVINISADSVLNQFGSTITGGTINSTGTGVLTAFNNNANFLDGVTLNGTLNLASGAQTRERVVNGLSLGGRVDINNSSILAFQGSQTLSGSGSIVFADAGGGGGILAVDGGGTTLTVGSNMVIRGLSGIIGDQVISGGGGGQLINQGLISSDSGGTITIRTLAAGVVNTSTLRATGAGSVLNLSGIDINNAGGQIQSLNNGIVLHSGGTISGGAINSGGGGAFQATNSNANFLDGVTLNGTLNMATGAQVRERIVGGMIVNGTVNLNSSAYFAVQGTQTLSGSGSIVFGDGTGGTATIGVDGAGTALTVDSNLVIRGKNGIIGDQVIAGGGGGSLINNGRISADVAGGSIIIRGLANGVTNNNLIEAQNGGTLRLQSNVQGNVGSQLVAGVGSTISQESVTLSGAINTSGGGSFQPNNSNANFLDGVTFAGSLNMATGSQVRERVVNGLVLNGTVNLNNSALLAFQGTQTLSGSGSIVFGDGTGGTGFIGVDGVGTALTVGSSIVIRGQNGVIGDQLILGGGGGSLINNGRISADVAGGAIIIRTLANGVTNNNLIEAQNGGTLRLQSNVQGNVGSQLVAGVGSTISQESVTLSGAINTSGGGSFQPNNSNANFLDGVTFAGSLNMATGAQVRERVINGLVLNGTINLNNSALLAFEGTQTLSGSGSIVFGDGTGGTAFIGVDGANTALTVGSNMVIRGLSGVIGDQLIAGGGGGQLINQGLISSDSGGTITIRTLAAGVVNTSTLRATGAGSVLNLSGIDINNAGGQIQSLNNGIVLHSGGTISGGAINSGGGGAFQATNSNANFLDGVTLNGTLNMATGGQTRERVVNGMTLNGTINLNDSSLLAFQGTQLLGGTGSIIFGNGANGTASLGVDGAGPVLTVGSGVTVRGQNGIIGDQLLAGGGGNQLVNNGRIASDGGGTITIRQLAAGIVNNGTLQAQNGTLTIAAGQGGLTGTGTLQVDAAGTLNLANSPNTQGKLLMGAAGATLNLGTQNLTITNDYTNTAAGSGNSFNRRAGVSGTGLVVAGANAAQAITGTGVTNGATANATLTLGNVRVGATTFNYQVANTGATGPSLRGAIQTNVNGANLTDARLSGTGVTASNYLTGAPGNNTGNLGVVFTAAAAGVLAPIAGQVLNLRSNFENIGDQKLNIVLAAGAAAYNAAVGSAVSPVVVANQRTNGSNTATVLVTNTAPAGAFSEDLNVSVGGTTGGISSTGSIAGRLGGANSGGGNITVGVNTTTAGAKSGTVTLDYQTAGAVNGVSNGLGVAAANASQVVNVTGNVYLAAQPSPGTLSSPINLGNFRAGAGAQAAPGIVISNTNVAPVGFQEGLAAAIISIGGQATGTGFTNAVAGGNGTLNVGLSGITAGLNTGTVGVQLRSNGTTTTGSNGLGNLDLGGLQTITVNANGYRLAQPNAIAAVNFGNVLANSVQTRTITVSNGATADGFSEALNAAFGTIAGANAASFSTAGAISGLLAGNSNNTTMVVTLNTSASGTKTANVQVLLDSNGNAIGNGLGLTALPTQVINLDGVITANVGNLASAGLSPTNVNFGKFREGAANQTQQLTVSNLTVGMGEGLNASFGASSGGASHNGGSITSLATGGSNNTSMSVSLGGLATAGNKTGAQVLNFVSDGSFNGGVTTNLPAQTVNLSADVYRLATAGVNTPINLAARRVGDAAATGTLTVSNSAANDGFSEGLRGAIGAAPSGFSVSGAASTGLIAAGASEARTVSLSTAVAGNFGGNVTIGMVSNGTGTSGFGDAALANKVVALTGKVYTQATGQLGTPVIDFGIVRVGQAVAALNIMVNNTAAVTTLNDTLRADLSGVSGPFSSGNTVSGVAAQGSGQIAVALNTSAAGIHTQNGSVSFLSQNPDMVDVSAGANAAVLVKAQINNLANADFDLLMGLGLLTQNGNDYILDLGNVALSGTEYTLAVRLDNDVAGPADDLSGLFDLAAVDEFNLTGFGAAVGPLGAGQATGNLGVGFLAAVLGLHEDIVNFNGFSSNASDPAGIAQMRRLIIRANVIDPNGNPIPEPGTLGLLLIAAVGAAVARRQRQRAH